MSDPLPRRGDRVALRRFRAGDLAAFQAYRGDPEVARYQSWEAMTDERARGFIDAVAAAPLFEPGEWIQIAVAAAEDDGLIGDIGVRVDEDGGGAELGVTLARAAQGRGLAAEACRLAIALIFEATEAERVFALADIRNAPSLALLKRLGMTRRERVETEEDGEVFVEDLFDIRR